ncbi:type II toxin-antitoxin system HigB family toxin [Thermodesulfobacteriota bacterium]
MVENLFKNSFLSFNDLKKTFGAADIVHKCIIFNIGGGKYRMIVRINFSGHRMWIKYIVTHEIYNKMNLLKDPKCLP